MIDGKRLVSSTYVADDKSTYPQIGFITDTWMQNDGAVSIKIPFGRFVASFNLLFKLNESGLRDNATPHGEHGIIIARDLLRIEHLRSLSNLLVTVLRSTKFSALNPPCSRL